MFPLLLPVFAAAATPGTEAAAAAARAGFYTWLRRLFRVWYQGKRNGPLKSGSV